MVAFFLVTGLIWIGGASLSESVVLQHLLHWHRLVLHTGSLLQQTVQYWLTGILGGSCRFSNQPECVYIIDMLDLGVCYFLLGITYLVFTL